MTSTTRTLMADSARARSLASAVIWLDLDARGRAQLEARDHRPGVHRDHLDLHAEVAQLELHQPRHGLERLGRVGGLAHARVIEQVQRRQFLDSGGSKSGTCRSFSTRSLFGGGGAGGSMRGGWPCFCRLLLHSRMTSLRAGLLLAPVH